MDRSLVQFFLRKLTRKKKDGRCPLENIFQAYRRTRNSLIGKARSLPAFLFIELLRKMASARRDFLAEEVFGYPPRARALVNTARRLGSFPQLWKMARSAWIMGYEAYYLAGHAKKDG